MQSRRLPNGGRIDRSKEISFSFNGRLLTGYAGDTLASALIANGISLVARSIKYHRPRGILSAGLEEPSALLACTDIHGVFIPNLKATEVRLAQNMQVRSQNCWPNLWLDVGALLQLGSKLLSAGFYYKTFMWPQKCWHSVYEKMIRRAAGQGKLESKPDQKLYDKRNTYCDVLVIGSGPKGLSAAISAAKTNSSVLLIEQDQSFGGTALWEYGDTDNSDESPLSDSLQKLDQLPNVRCMINTLAFGQYDHGLVLAVEKIAGTIDSIYWRIRAKEIIVATGAIERPLIFPGNDRPGIMLAAAVRQYIYRYAVIPGMRAFIAVNDINERSKTKVALEYAGIRVVDSLAEGEAITATYGWHRIHKLGVMGRNGITREVDCDLVCVSAGWMPTGHLCAQLGDKSVIIAALSIESVFARGSGGRGKAFVDLQNDVTRTDLELALREGYDHVELAKRYTTLGMGTDQGKTSWPNAICEIAEITHQTPEQVGTTTFRPPYSPVSLGALVGADTDQHMAPTRHTPFHQAFKKHGCVFQTTGNWIYSRYFPQSGETMQQAITREVLTVRSALGCVDMSTLGKIDVKGSDALKFLSRIYCNNLDSLTPGRVRYALMLREDGILYDDGTVAQLSENHYFITMTTSNSASVWLWLKRMQQTQWSELDVQLTSVTDQWASLAIAGPESRKLLTDLKPNFDIDKDSFAFASVREGTLRGDMLGTDMPCRIFSVSFSGELSYEINVPAGYASALFDNVINLGTRYGITAYGLEALDVLRIEKGHISVGTEIDGRATAADLGLGKMVSSKKDFIGKALLQRPALNMTDRPQLVGLKPVDKQLSIPVAALVTDQPWQQGVTQTRIGQLTATIDSPVLKHSIALALVNNGHQRLNETLWAVSPINQRSVQVSVVPACFYDAEGRRLHE